MISDDASKPSDHLLQNQYTECIVCKDILAGRQMNEKLACQVYVGREEALACHLLSDTVCVCVYVSAGMFMLPVPV